MRNPRPPLSGLMPGAYRPQRRWQLEGVIGRDGYAQRLPPEAKAWLEQYCLEAYAVESKRIAAGIHADRVNPDGSVDTSRRRALYDEQNRANRDAFNRGVLYLEEAER